MIKERIVIFLIILFTGVACIPETPTGNVVDPSSEYYTVPTPENFSIVQLPSGKMQVRMDVQSNTRVTGQELFLVYNGELNEDFKFEINTTIGRTDFNPTFLDFAQTFAIRSYYEIENERIYSDFAYFTFEVEDVLPSIEFVNVLNYALFKTNFFNPDFHIIVEYASDSVNFETIINRFAAQKLFKLDKFQTRFSGELDGLFRYKIKHSSGLESDFITTGSNRFSPCKGQPTSSISPSIDATENRWEGIYFYWDSMGECYDEIFIFQQTHVETEYRLIGRHSKNKSFTILNKPTNISWFDLKVKGVRYGEGIVSESETVRMIYENGRWVKDEE